jgi:hypothetical protein
MSSNFVVASPTGPRNLGGTSSALITLGRDTSAIFRPDVGRTLPVIGASDRRAGATVLATGPSTWRISDALHTAAQWNESTKQAAVEAKNKDAKDFATCVVSVFCDVFARFMLS